MKGRTTSCQYNFTLSLSFDARVGIPQGACIFPTLFNFFDSTFSESDNFLTNSYADDFTDSCSNSNVDQMAEALSAYSSNIEERADERGLDISAPKSTIPLCTPQFAQSNTYRQVSMNNSILPLERTHIKSLVIRDLPRINIFRALPTGVSKRKPYLSSMCLLYGPYSLYSYRERIGLKPIPSAPPVEWNPTPTSPVEWNPTPTSCFLDISRSVIETNGARVSLLQD